MTASTPKTTPMMAQWHACKESAPGCLLLFRMGDFYEAFYDDAALLARELELTLTKRQDIPMSGVPWHAADNYIDRLIEKGHRVAIAEQVEDPKKAKGIVKREVVRIVTPGTVVSSSLSEKNNNFVVTLEQVGKKLGMACLDLTTGEFRAFECEEIQTLLNEVCRLRPSEVLYSNKFGQNQAALVKELRQHYRFLPTVLENWRLDHQITVNCLLHHFQVKTLEGFGLASQVAATHAAGALLAYIRDTLSQPVDHITEVQSYDVSHFMTLDAMTQRNLELTALIDILDQTYTPMGGRMLRQWVKQPLLDVAEITARQEAVEAFGSSSAHRLCELLDTVRDLERLMTKVSSGYATPRDLLALSTSLIPLPEIKALLQKLSSPLIQQIDDHLLSQPELIHKISSTLVEEPPARLTDGNVIRSGVSEELDELRSLQSNSKSWLVQYQNDLKTRFDIKTLKVGYNRMFGYYIEVSRGQSDKMPDTFERRQTLVNAERFISPELKDYENKILNAEERIGAIESELFSNLRKEIAPFAPSVMQVAHHIAKLDCLLSLAAVAKVRNYCRPTMDTSHTLSIQEGRHPIIEAADGREKFIANDTSLDFENERMMVITGPNMAGKSTYIRQVALICILAQIGSFVPAKSAHVGIIDKVFTRIGASDDLSRGLSTFMVEMTETSNILHNATDRSLVILDEIGRGTSTYDGISIAWAVTEYLLTAEGKQAKTLFATHFWEMTQLEKEKEGVVNYNVAVSECDDQVIFLRKIVRGGTDKSYGIHVAKLAGMPSWVVERAGELLTHLETTQTRRPLSKPAPKKRAPKTKRTLAPKSSQLTLFN